MVVSIQGCDGKKAIAKRNSFTVKIKIMRIKFMIRKYLLPVLLILCMQAPAQQQVKVMSYNIRLDVASDGENRWDLRKDKVAGLMNYYEADFIGGQEVQHH
jgi:hypothetical protein